MNLTGNHCEHAVRRYVAFFERLEPAALNHLETVFAADVRFKDPFNDVRGRDAVRRMFDHMFRTTEHPAFVVLGWWCDGWEASIHWRFECRLRGLVIDFPGMSFVRFNDAGLAVEHVDYWNPVEGMYEKIPLLGGLMRYLRRRFAAA